MRSILILAVGAALLAACSGGGKSATQTDTPHIPEVIAQLRNAGLPIGEFDEYDASTDPNELLGRPRQYIAKANFHDTRLDFSETFSTDSGGSIEIFGSEDDAERRLEYVRSVTESNPLFSEYQFLHGVVLLRIANELTPEQAAEYERALN